MYVVQGQHATKTMIKEKYLSKKTTLKNPKKVAVWSIHTPFCNRGENALPSAPPGKKTQKIQEIDVKIQFKPKYIIISH